MTVTNKYYIAINIGGAINWLNLDKHPSDTAWQVINQQSSLSINFFLLYVSCPSATEFSAILFLSSSNSP